MQCSLFELRTVQKFLSTAMEFISYSQHSFDLFLFPTRIYPHKELVCLLIVLVTVCVLVYQTNKYCTIPGPRGLPLLGCVLSFTGLCPHRKLAELAKVFSPHTGLISVPIGSTKLIVASKPQVAKEILNSPWFADRPLKQSAQELLFGRAIGFAPHGEYWRNLRRIASNHLFSPQKIASQEPIRRLSTSSMIAAIAKEAGPVHVRSFLQRASLTNMMWCIFGVRYDFHVKHEHVMSRCMDGFCPQELESMVCEGFELLGAFNWADHLHFLSRFDPQEIHKRCRQLVARVCALVGKIIHRHRSKEKEIEYDDFVDVLLQLQEQDNLQDGDIIAILWEMIFRGTDTTAILTEWILAELVVHPEIQRRVRHEIDTVVGSESIVTQEHISRLTYMQAVVKETLRLHPPGPLLSWARLCTGNTVIAGHPVAKGTNAMVNMWAITHDPSIWKDPECFNPDRFLTHVPFDIKGSDLRLAPFGAGRRVCPGRMLGLATVHMWLACLLHKFEWTTCPAHPVLLDEILKLSSQMATPLVARPLSRN